MKMEMEEGYTKMKDIKDDNFTEVQSYFKEKSIETTRMAFRVRCKMVKDIPGNFKQKYKKEGLTCKYCNGGDVMSQSHCVECPACSDLREGLDLMNILDMVKFFQKLLTERARLDSLDV